MEDTGWQKKMSRADFLRVSAGVALGSAAIGSFGLSACGGSTGGSGSPAPASQSTLKARPDGDINYFTWAEYVDPGVVKAFEKQYGVKVKQSFFASDEAMVQKLASGLSYDVVTTNSAYIPRLLAGSLLQPLPHDQLTSFADVIPFFQNPTYDPGSAYSVPYGYGPTGISWRTDKVDSTTLEGSWNDLWNKSSADGHKFVLDQIEEALGMSLQRLGFPVDSADPAQMDQATTALIELKPQLAGFSTDDIGNLSSGEAWLCEGWGCDAYYAAGQLKDPKLVAFAVPKEGGLIASDTMSIPVSAKSPGTALLFIDWLLQPENSVKCVQWHGQMNGTNAGIAAWKTLMADYPWLSYPDNVLDTCAWKTSPTGERLQLMNRAWTKVKAS
jgi:spermidine/putrescine transport system substrate-binding protein